jgi:hypothetical protein
VSAAKEALAATSANSVSAVIDAQTRLQQRGSR